MIQQKKDRSNKIRTICDNIFLIIISSMIMLVIGEISLRIYVNHQLKKKDPIYPIFETINNSKRAYRLKANSKIHAYKINTMGFRNPEFNIDKDDKTFRIISLGDSIAFGMGVKSQEKILSRVLEELLNEERGNRRFQVINAGVPGYNTFQKYLYLIEELIHYNPDFVFLNFCLNDADPIELENETQTLLTLPHNLKDYNLSLRIIINQSYLLRFIKSKILEIHPKLRNMAINKRIYEKEWDDMKGYLLKMNELLKDMNIPFMIVLFPWQVQLANEYNSIETNKDLSFFLNKHNIDYLDLFHRLQDNKDAILFFKDGVHPTEIGHRIAAEEIFRQLKEKYRLCTQITSIG